MQSSNLIFLDGGCGMELKKRKSEGLNVAYDLSLFSSAALLYTPDGIRQLHSDYIKSGANVITTASYAATKFYLDRVNKGDCVNEYAKLSVKLAKDAVKESNASGHVLIAGSVPPLGESYHACNLPKEEIIKQYTELVSGLDGVDLFLIETMHNLDEVKYAVSICKEIFGDSITIWISFNPRHKHINSNDNTVCIQDGTSIRDVINELLKLNVKALLFNCATPEIISLAIKEAGLILKELGWKDKIKIGGYANIWEEMDLTNWSIEKNESAPGASDQKKGGMIVRNDIFGSPQLYLAKVQEWKNDGASILGGCCGIGPEHIQHMCKNLKPN